MTPLDRRWLADHPLPVPETGTDKNGRGRVLAVGGGTFVPGALLLTGEAAFRAGAGKVQLGTVEPVAISLGVRIPEAAILALPADADGEIAAAAGPLIAEMLERCDTFLLGPGMGARCEAEAIVRCTLAAPRPDLSILLDAACIACAGDLASLFKRHEGRLVLTPHHGEMARLAGRDEDAIKADPSAVAIEAAATFGAVVALKGAETLIAAPDGRLLHYPGGGVGLATGGSGDVLAGVIAGLLARGADPFTATAWGVWLHGEAGRRIAETVGSIGLLARELLPVIPALMAAATA